MTSINWENQVKKLKSQLHLLYLASQDRRLPWYLRLLPWLVLAYALSPIDLIPDFIPLLGYLDDLLLLPLGIIIALKLIPEAYKAEYRQQIATNDLPRIKAGVVIIIVIWLGLVALSIFWFVNR